MEMNATPIRLIIADRQDMFREGLKRLLNMQPDFLVETDSNDGDQLPALVNQFKPDVLLFNHRLRKRSGIEALREISALKFSLRPVLLTEDIDGNDIIEALMWGTRGVVRKECDTSILFKSIRSVMTGDYWIGHSIMADLIQYLHSLLSLVEQKTRQQSENLTRQQAKIIEAIISGSSNKDIADDLSLSERTVKYHLTRIYTKFGVSNRMELARYSIQNKVLPGM